MRQTRNILLAIVFAPLWLVLLSHLKRHVIIHVHSRDDSGLPSSSSLETETRGRRTYREP